MADSAPGASFGVIITNRDRPQPLGACLGSLAGQDAPPAWVVLCDLGSQPPHGAALATLAGHHGVSYLRIDHVGAWNKSLAFNTAFRRALCALPAVTHIIQLDADMILHPHLLGLTAARLRAVPAFWCAPRSAPPGLATWPVPGDPASFGLAAAQCGPVLSWATGAFMVLPCGWLAQQRGFDEAFTGWGHEDTELWWRARSSLPGHGADTSGALLIHQWHPRQPGADSRGANWSRFLHCLASPPAAVNPAGWGEGRVAEFAPRSGMSSALQAAGRPRGGR